MLQEKPIRWNTEKNISLKALRKVSFEEILSAIAHGGLLKTFTHPNAQKYPNQQVWAVLHKAYVYLIPFVENEAEVFLKTIVPSRKMTKLLLQRDPE